MVKKLQKHLFRHQTNKNRSFEGKSVDVIVENKMRDQQKLFGRNKYLNSVIFHGDINDIGKMLKVKIESTNSNTLFGKVEKNNDNYIHKGVAQRAFMKRLQLSEYVECTGAKLEDGMLKVELVYDPPEDKKAKKITVK